MGHKHVFINSNQEGYLFIKNNLLCFKDNKDKLLFALDLEDVECINCQSHKVTISSYALSLISIQSCIVFCGANGMPNSILRSFDVVYGTYNLNLQIDMKQTLKNALHQKIIKTKLKNSADFLKHLKKKKHAVLLKLSYDVLSKDSSGREGVGAFLYFRDLFGSDFLRKQHYDKDKDHINVALNYGYAIIRSLVANALISHGFNLSLGLFHRSKTNSYNLADDFMEPFRVVCDYYVYKNRESILKNGLNRSNKQKIKGILHARMEIDGTKFILNDSIHQMCSSFKNVLEKKNKDLLVLPKMIFGNVK